jgi:hypothetical protein
MIPMVQLLLIPAYTRSCRAQTELVEGCSRDTCAACLDGRPLRGLFDTSG